jgi:hypothetical protein
LQQACNPARAWSPRNRFRHVRFPALQRRGQPAARKRQTFNSQRVMRVIYGGLFKANDYPAFSTVESTKDRGKVCRKAPGSIIIEKAGFVT